MHNPAVLEYKILAMHHFQMAPAVYCSNFIERIEPSLEDIMTSLTLMVFSGEKVLDIRTEYEEKEHLADHCRKDKEKMTLRNVVTGRRKVIQHSKALMYILKAMVNLNFLLTES